MRYTKKDIESPTTLYSYKFIQIWRLRICWYRFMEDNVKFKQK